MRNVVERPDRCETRTQRARGCQTRGTLNCMQWAKLDKAAGFTEFRKSGSSRETAEMSAGGRKHKACQGSAYGSKLDPVAKCPRFFLEENLRNSVNLLGFTGYIS